MNRALKITVATLGGLFTLFLLTLAILYILVNPNTLRDQAQTWVAENTDRTLTIKGDMHWSFTAGIGMSAHDVTLSNPQKFGQGTFASAKTMTVTVQLLPLLHKEVAINHINLDGLDLNLINKPANINNWTFTRKKPHEASQNNVAVNINRISLSNSTIHLDNQRGGHKLLFSKVKLSTGSMHPGSPFHLSGRAHLQGTRPELDTHVAINGKIQYIEDQQQLKIDDFELTSTHPKQVLSSFSLHTTGELDFKAERFKLTKFNIDYAKEMSASGFLLGSHFLSKPTFKGHFTTQPINVKNLLNNLGHPIKTKNKNALKSLRLTTDIEANPQEILLSKLNLQLDNTPFSGQARLNLDQHQASIDLRGTQLTVDDYLLQPTQSTFQKNANDKTHTTAAFTLKGRLQMEQVKSGSVIINNPTMQWSYRNQALTLSPITANVFGGSTRGSATLNFSGNNVTFTLQQTLTLVDLKQTLSTLLNTSPISGRANIQANLSGSNGSAQNIMKSLNGSVTLDAKHGVLYGLDIDYQVARVVAHMSKDTISARNTQQSAFNRISGTLNFANGVVNNPALDVSLPKYHIKGKGRMNLLNQGIQYQLGMKPLYPLNVSMPIGKTDLSQYYLPLSVSGTLSDPKPSLDFPGIVALTLQKQATDILKKTITAPIENKVIDTLKSKLPF